MNKTKLLLALLMGMTVFVSGCATHGSKIDTDFASNIQKGVTTENDIRENLGAPQNVGLDGHGNKTMTYVYAKSQAKAESFIPVVGSLMGGADTESTTLIVIIDSKTGLVKDYALNDSKTETKTGIM